MSLKIYAIFYEFLIVMSYITYKNAHYFPVILPYKMSRPEVY